MTRIIIVGGGFAGVRCAGTLRKNSHSMTRMRLPYECLTSMPWNLCVLDQHERLEGVVTRSELFEAFEQGKGPATKVEDFKLKHPMMVTLDESPFTVAELMHKHDVDWMPAVENKETRRLIGVIRSERMLRCLVAQMVDG